MSLHHHILLVFACHRHLRKLLEVNVGTFIEVGKVDSSQDNLIDIVATALTVDIPLHRVDGIAIVA